MVWSLTLRPDDTKQECHTAVIFRWYAVFRFLAVTTLAEAVRPKYGGNFSAVGGFSSFRGNPFGGGGKIKFMAVILRR